MGNETINFMGNETINFVGHKTISFVLSTKNTSLPEASRPWVSLNFDDAKQEHLSTHSIPRGNTVFKINTF